VIELSHISQEMKFAHSVFNINYILNSFVEQVLFHIQNLKSESFEFTLCRKFYV